MSRMTVTLVWLDGTTEIANPESVSLKDGVLSLFPPGYGYSYSTPVRKIPLDRLREWSERR